MKFENKISISILVSWVLASILVMLFPGFSAFLFAFVGNSVFCLWGLYLVMHWHYQDEFRCKLWIKLNFEMHKYVSDDGYLVTVTRRRWGHL